MAEFFSGFVKITNKHHKNTSSSLERLFGLGSIIFACSIFLSFSCTSEEKHTYIAIPLWLNQALQLADSGDIPGASNKFQIISEIIEHLPDDKNSTLLTQKDYAILSSLESLFSANLPDNDEIIIIRKLLKPTWAHQRDRRSLLCEEFAKIYFESKRVTSREPSFLYFGESVVCHDYFLDRFFAEPLNKFNTFTFLKKKLFLKRRINTKVLPICLHNEKPFVDSYVYARMPVSLRPNVPDEVGAILLLLETKVTTTEFYTPTSGPKHNVERIAVELVLPQIDAKVIDIESKTVEWERMFTARAPSTLPYGRKYQEVSSRDHILRLRKDVIEWLSTSTLVESGQIQSRDIKEILKTMPR
jgi:hypothetical protein